jgi:type III pantothenate kinase
MTLCDIGNSFYHFWIDGKIIHHPVDEPLTPFEGEIYYITVNKSAEKNLLSKLGGINIAPFSFLEGSYATMGIDRIVACIGANDGIVVDAGSAITIDVMDQGFFKGGYILSGFGVLRDTMKNISPALDMPPLFENESIYPKSTPHAIGCGYKMAVVSMINKLAESENKPIYLTGGDANVLTNDLQNTIYDEELIFRGMKKILETKGITC